MSLHFEESRWYVIRTKPRSEQRAQSYLEQNGIVTFLPWMETCCRGRALTGTALKPLFPGYLFAHFVLGNSYPLVRWGKGVHTILGFGNMPCPMADEAISIIKSRTDEKNVVRKAYRLNKNDPVRITSGPMKDLLGIFERWVSDSGRVRILLNLIGYQPRVEIHYTQLEKMCA